MNKERLKRLEGISQRIIAEFFIDELKELEVDFGLINISNIKISSDLSYIDIYVSSFSNNEILCKTLANYAHEMQRKLNKSLNLRKNPKIRFRYDESGEISSEILDTINNL